MKPVTLQSRIFSYGALFVSVIAVIIGLSFYYTMSQGIEQQIGERALSIAMTTADRPDIRAGFEHEHPTEALQPIAEAIRLKTGAEYVVIGNNEGVRYAHPVPERIGKKMVGDDNERALKLGESYISEATGSLGPALRGKAPVFNEQGHIIGVVSVGFLTTDISSMFFQYADNILYIVLIAIILGVIGSSILARNIKKELFDLEPAEAVAKEKLQYKKFIIILVSAALYAFLLEKIGYVISTFLFLLIAFQTMERGRYLPTILIAAIFSFGVYYFFAEFLGGSLPGFPTF